MYVSVFFMKLKEQQKWTMLTILNIRETLFMACIWSISFTDII